MSEHEEHNPDDTRHAEEIQIPLTEGQKELEKLSEELWRTIEGLKGSIPISGGARSVNTKGEPALSREDMYASVSNVRLIPKTLVDLKSRVEDLSKLIGKIEEVGLSANEDTDKFIAERFKNE